MNGVLCKILGHKIVPAYGFGNHYHICSRCKASFP